ncbi:hypothetical protein RO3G_14493 [Rhizopus delemar RA 99-880]|uniref:Uncharacterized protein n=1 Tax=Rhizopus delemar (strain RA 99-880 / ATCC MYA-4621 / FGSC 9543 / NRRL 43880) TaxID=246409 RepID=I1CMV2_RHIO9|nr:hypothetical protein RO3G_14493 [Rhizopus delemar RA 99-880]|eukprot:EIE89782.1 hypothetical protein RO3G_14493 [Rhizopus delemar RA 99-880]
MVSSYSVIKYYAQTNHQIFEKNNINFKQLSKIKDVKSKFAVTNGQVGNDAEADSDDSVVAGVNFIIRDD